MSFYWIYDMPNWQFFGLYGIFCRILAIKRVFILAIF